MNALPPGWPQGVRPPGAPHWERSAINWLLDHCPPDYRAYPVFTRHPLVLALVSLQHLRAALDGCRRAQSTARADLRGAAAPEVIEEVLEALSAEEARLVAAGRAADLLLRALRGERYVPRL